MLTRDDFLAALQAAGVRKGDTLMVQSNLRRLGSVEAPRSKGGILEFYVEGFRRALGEEGTLVVLTAFEDYARHGMAFDRRHSPSLSGALSEHIRCLPGAVRSRHPVLSITALGPQANALCDGPHFEGFGYDSAWGRLHRANAKIMTLGYAIAPDGMTFCHYLENLYGVPYQYTKVYDHPVLDDGVPQPGTWTMPVRYLDFGVENDQSFFKRCLVEADLAKIHPVGRGQLLITDCDSMVAHALKRFAEDRYMMLVRPPAFRRGEIPFDVKGSAR
ncbi:MAG: AAC(3) family N-acetyltransferase [Kiloniellales bacterium]